MKVLWIYGTSCVGKSTAAWHLYDGWQLDDGRISYVDIDQLGMCYPARTDDPERDRLKAAALHGLIRSLKQVPVSLLIISGIMDPKHLADYTAIDGVEFVFVRLRLAEGDLTRRCMARWGSQEMTDAILEDARYLDRSALPHASLDATGLTVAEVADGVLAAAGLTSSHTTAPEPVEHDGVPPLSGQVLVVCGPRPAGKSTIGFRAASALWQSEATAGYLDLAQLDFVRPPLSGAERDQNLAAKLLAVWRVFHDAGARRLVVSGPFTSPQELEGSLAALQGSDVTICRLEADESALRERLAVRSVPGGPELAGDDLLGKDPDACEAVLSNSLKETAAWSDWKGGPVIDTSQHDVNETLVRVLQSAGWMPRT